ncbi:MAG: hypothetical protein B7Z55_00515 [Planctomycetales bacterium 12-60-4]|nr:MAG: hypothetical protein B7Z55_00515 [Planctomycetales bacterium 12-60-4]
MGHHERCLLFLCLVLAGWHCPSFGQQASGGLRVRVEDADFYSPLQGVAVAVEGLSAAGITDENGNLFIQGIPAGNYTLLFSREGYVRERRNNVLINEGQIKEVSVSMTGIVVELEEYVVPALEEEALSSAISTVQIQTNLKSLATVMGKDFLSKSGASDVAKALSKAAGINIVDGRFVVVRGLSDRYNTVSMNGSRVPAADPDRRAVALDIFPSSVVEAIVTSKTFLPFMPGESTGGAINVVTKARPLKREYSLKIQSGYNTQATGNKNFLTYRGGGTGMFGTAGSRSLNEQVNAENNLPLNPTGTRAERTAKTNQKIAFGKLLTPVFGTETRAPPLDFIFEATLAEPFEFMGLPAGFIVSVDYRKTYSFSDADAVARYQFLPQPGGGFTAEILRGGNVTRGKEVMRSGLMAAMGVELPNDGKLGFTFFFNRLAEDVATDQSSVDASQQESLRQSLAYTERQISTYQLYGNHVSDNRTRIDWIMAYNQTSQLEPDQRVFESLYNSATNQYVIPATFFVSPFRRYWREVYDSNYSANLDISVPLWTEGEKDTVLRFGGSFDRTTREYTADSFAYDNRTTANGYNAPAGSTSTFADEFFNLSPDRQLFRINPEETYSASQLILAGFGMIDLWKDDRLNLTVGSRVEVTELQVQASPLTIYDPSNGISPLLLGDNPSPELFQNLQDAVAGRAPASAELLARSRARISQVDMLPALNASYIIDDVTLRGAVTRTVARPSFKEIAPVPFFVPDTGDIFLGNVDLKMSSIINYDFRAEWKPEPSRSVGLGFFSKAIRNAIELSNGGVLKYRNTPRAEVYGFEFDMQSSLDFLVEELRNFSLGFNYTYIYSRADLFAPSAFADTRRLQGQPDYIFNTSLTYDNKDTGWYAGVFLNVTGPMLSLAGAGDTFPDVIQYPVTTLDLGISKTLGKHAKITFRANNVTNPIIENRYNTPDRSLFSRSKAGVAFSMALNLTW